MGYLCLGFYIDITMAHTHFRKALAYLSLSILSFSFLNAQSIRPTHYDEQKVPVFEAPALLTCDDGSTVTTQRQWERKRRPELLDLLASQEYGYTPTQRIRVHHEVVCENPVALEGKATSRQVRFTFRHNNREVEAMLLLFIPNDRKGKVPVIVSYNFNGNPSTTTETDVLPSPGMAFIGAKAEVTAAGTQASRWDYDAIISRGYAVATMCYNDIYPDKPELRDHSVVALFDGYHPHEVAPDEWQAIGAWAWGSSRIADYLLKQRWVDKKHLALMGHSRQGKAALWAGAQDKRFQVIISNESGCGGAALSKRCYGETVARINTSFPHWFCKNFTAYNDKEELLPFDQHALLALIAPRHLYVASAEGDNWSDQRGEFLGTTLTDEVYALYGMHGLGTTVMPDIHHPIQHDSGYHIRAGKHDVTSYDWQCYLDFCDKHFR